MQVNHLVLSELDVYDQKVKEEKHELITMTIFSDVRSKKKALYSRLVCIACSRAPFSPFKPILHICDTTFSHQPDGSCEASTVSPDLDSQTYLTSKIKILGISIIMSVLQHADDLRRRCQYLFIGDWEDGGTEFEWYIDHRRRDNGIVICKEAG